MAQKITKAKREENLQVCFISFFQIVDWNLRNTFKSEAKSGSPCKDLGWTMLHDFSSESSLFVLNLQLLLADLKLNIYVSWIYEYMRYFFWVYA